ncbi:phosphatase PAP2 family protein [Ruminiclostridium sufflavum]|uniref:phosphatase PAP2 family protein n=1 Tax=Ruminiclostridium sufflavum TaxID=396504 RepID=UPI001403CCAC|nr:phosphatase PAP2 family protein [Ruminiclostridium sufflavum]
MKTLRYLLTIGLPAVLFAFIMKAVINQNTVGFDSYIYQRISRLVSPGLTEIMKLITFFGSTEFLLTAAAILIVFFFMDEKCSFYASMIVINLMLAALLNEGLKKIIQRHRPDILKLIDIGGYSFPSGHSMVSMSFYGFLIYLCWTNFKTRWKYPVSALLSGLILLIGFSRIYLGVHYASDVLGGFCLGAVSIGVFSIIADIGNKE